MHNAAFEVLGIDARYLAFDVAPDALEAAFRGALALGFRQLAVSVPHKEAALALVDTLDDTAEAIGALNTVTLHEGTLRGANTDWIGALRALERETELDGKRAVVLGAGGTARAVTFALLRAGASVTVLNRNPSRAAALCTALGAGSSGALDDIRDVAFDVLVNTTSVGMGSDESPIPDDATPENAVVLDAVYAPEDTRLLRNARRRGARTVGGKWMLVAQAVEQIRLWTGLDAPADVMARAFDEAAV